MRGSLELTFSSIESEWLNSSPTLQLILFELAESNLTYEHPPPPPAESFRVKLTVLKS